MDQRPNILLVMSDQHNPHIVGCEGDSVVRTPRIDALAERGVRFASNYCPSPLCVPSRMSFLTSRYPSDQRVWSNSCVLDSSIPTFAHGLSVAGYETVLCGRMHFIGPDQRHGFEKRLVGDLSPQHPGTPGPRMLPSLHGSTSQTRPAAIISGPGQTEYQVFDETVTDAACEFLKARSDGRPLCMVVGFVLPHCPFVCPRHLYQEYYDKVQLPSLPDGHFDAVHPFVHDYRRLRQIEDLTDEQVQSARAAYYGLITIVDGLVGQIVDVLAETALRDNTVVIYTSDHGDMAGEHGMWWKSNFYEGAGRVPLIVSWPGHFAEGRTVRQVSSLLDVGPTLLDLAGAESLPSVRGRSLLRFLLPGKVDTADWPDETFAEHYSGKSEPPSRMIRSGPWKLIHYHGYEAPQLFNLDDDPDELNDLGSDPQFADIRNRLRVKVVDSWDPELVEREVTRRFEDVGILRQWGRVVQPACPDRWQAPPGANVFPDK